MTKKILLLILFIFSASAYAHCCPGICCTNESPAYKLAYLNIDFDKFIPAKAMQALLIQNKEIPSVELNNRVDAAQGDVRSRLLDIMLTLDSGDNDKIFDLASNCFDFIDAQSKLSPSDSKFAHNEQYRDWQKKLNDAIKAAYPEANNGN